MSYQRGRDRREESKRQRLPDELEGSFFTREIQTVLRLRKSIGAPAEIKLSGLEKRRVLAWPLVCFEMCNSIAEAYEPGKHGYDFQHAYYWDPGFVVRLLETIMRYNMLPADQWPASRFVFMHANTSYGRAEMVEAIASGETPAPGLSSSLENLQTVSKLVASSMEDFANPQPRPRLEQIIKMLQREAVRRNKLLCEWRINIEAFWLIAGSRKIGESHTLPFVIRL